MITPYLRNAQCLQKKFFKLLRKRVNNAFGILPKYFHLPFVSFACQVALEPVLITALLLAHLAVPPQLLEALLFHAIGDLQRVLASLSK